MGKSSASRKKKRPKKPSKVQASGKSKSRRHASKKLRQRREASPSISDYSDSVSSDSSWSSSSEDSYRSRRARSSKRKDEKVRRKMAKRHSYRHESSGSCRDRKRKRSKRKSGQEARARPYKKKKLRKEESVSSMSNVSLSCSTCYGESASSYDNESERHRARVERKGKEKGPDRGRSESESERSNRYRARSCSPRSFSSESSDQQTEEAYVSKNNSRRLKSVITVIEVAEEGRELCHYETKEEIVDDHDYPCGSNDSNDRGSKRESDHHTHLTLKEKMGIEDTEVDRTADSNLTEPRRDQGYNNNNNNSQFDRSELDVNGAGISESVEKKTSETSGASLDGDDLEAILRKRALENLRKFRDEIQSSAKASGQKNRIDNDVIQPPIKSHELVQGKSIVNNAGEGKNFYRITNAENINLATTRRKSVASSSENEKDLNGVKGESVLQKYRSACTPEKVLDAENHNETVLASTIYVSNNSGHEKLVVTENAIDRHASDPVHRSNDNVKNIKALCSATQKPSKEQVKDHSQFKLKQTSELDKLHHTKCPPTVGNVDQNAAKTHDTIRNTSSSGRDVDRPCVSAIGKPSSESSPIENSSNNLQGEATQGSQFEQKTMNVMRGGEMVQVSYNVYIPKKTPALARRQLKR